MMQMDDDADGWWCRWMMRMNDANERWGRMMQMNDADEWCEWMMWMKDVDERCGWKCDEWCRWMMWMNGGWLNILDKVESVRIGKSVSVINCKNNK